MKFWMKISLRIFLHYKFKNIELFASNEKTTEPIAQIEKEESEEMEGI